MKIFLDVYLDNNLGDDIMVKGVLNRYKHHSFFAVSTDPIILETYRENKNLKFIKKDEKKEMMKTIDVYLTLGGSVFLFRKPANLIFRTKKIMSILKAKKHGAKILTVGSNLGPFGVVGSQTLTRYELSKNDDIAVRDSNSYNYIKKHVGNHVVFSDDIVFELIDEHDVEKNQNVVGISCYTPVNDKDLMDELVEKYINIVNQLLIENEDVMINLFAFDTLRENDLVVSELVKEGSIDKNRVTIYPYQGNVNDFLDVFKQSSRMIAVRFHSAILSEIFSIPFFPIAYSNKMENYIKDAYSVDTLSIVDFTKKGIELDKFNNSLLDFENRKELTKENLKVLDKYL